MPWGMSDAALPIAAPPCARPGARATLPATDPPCHASLRKAHSTVVLGIPPATVDSGGPFLRVDDPERGTTLRRPKWSARRRPVIRPSRSDNPGLPGRAGDEHRAGHGCGAV